MFPCTKCGECCKHIDKAVTLFTDAGFDINFPYKWNDGVCEKLVNNLCSIYENRPYICNIDRYIKENKVNKKAFYRSNTEACNKLMDETGINIKFRIKLNSTVLI